MSIFDRQQDPALRDLVVHFVGRRRGGPSLPGEVCAFSDPWRLARALLMGALRASTVPHSGDSPVVCASDVSAAELEAAFHTGINGRGALTPWALVLDRDVMWCSGMRPVLYVSTPQAQSYRLAAALIQGHGWEGLVVPSRIDKMLPDDWLHEREWRYCFPPSGAPQGLPFLGALRAVIVGDQGWEPSWPPPLDWRKDVDLSLPRPYLDGRYETSVTAERWLWDSDAQQLVPDGRLIVPALKTIESNESA